MIHRERIATAVALLVILVVAICLRLATAPIPLERDEGEYAYIGWRWLQGAVPYLDSFNQKTPGSFAVYAAVLRWFSSSPTALHWGIQLYNLASLALVFWLGLRLFGLAEAFVAALLACLLMADPNLFGNSANTETLAMLPLTAATIAALRAAESGGWRQCALTSGLLAGRPARLLSAGVALAIVAFCVHGSEPQILFYAQRESASRYNFVYALNLPFDEARDRQLEVLEELAERPPRLIVATFHQSSHLESPSTPQNLREGLRGLLESAYQLLAVVPYRSGDETRIVTSDVARRMWNRAPFWDRGRRPWAAFVVWERRSPLRLSSGR